MIDTPGFDDPKRSDGDILQSVASCLADLNEGLIFGGQEVNLAGVVYVHRIQDVRMIGTMVQNLNVFRSLVGQDNMDHCVLLTTKWGLEERSVAETRETELCSGQEYWRDDVRAGAKPVRFGDSHLSALEVLTTVIQRGSFVPQLTTEYVAEGRALMDTTAGRAINKDLAEIRVSHNKELAYIRTEYARAIEARDADAAVQMQALQRKTEKSVQKLEKDVKMLSNTRVEEQEYLDDLEYESTASLVPLESADMPSEHLTRRQKRALRWSVRFAGLGTAVALTALTHGAMAPLGVTLVIGIETILQAVKTNERHDLKFAQERYHR